MTLEISSNQKQLTLIASLILLGAGVSGGYWWLAQNQTGDPSLAGSGYSGDGQRILALAAPQLYKPLLPEQARLENKKLPFSSAPLEKALPLVLPWAELLPVGKRNATDCLTSAIYYEAGNESSQGKRAVAQVILNRVRHPAYPKTLCGVVYQGSERRTGCQFTFTCDGSLARRPARDPWEQARMIAIGAISGAVEPSVGMATHYHANYVLPYWASSLDKVSQIGTHIFYRWKGAWGRRKAFSQVIQFDNEVLTAITVAENISASGDQPVTIASPSTLASRIIADDVTDAGSLIAAAPEINGPTISPIQADQKRSSLAIDEKLATLKVNEQ